MVRVRVKAICGLITSRDRRYEETQRRAILLAARPCEASSTVAFVVRRGAAVLAHAAAQKAFRLVHSQCDRTPKVGVVRTKGSHLGPPARRAVEITNNMYMESGRCKFP